MKAITRTFALDVGRPGQQEVQYARQGDTRVYCYLIRLNDRSEPVEVPSDATVMLFSTKPDGTVTTLPGTPENGAAKVYLSAQTLTAPGIVRCQLCVMGADGAVLYAPRFDLVVDAAELPEDALASSDDFSALAQIVQNVRGMVERVAFSIVGAPYATVEALDEAVPNPYPYSLYAVGAEAPYDIYHFSGDREAGYNGWVNYGQIHGIQGIQGIQGIPGPQGPQGDTGPAGVLNAEDQAYIDGLKAAITFTEAAVDFNGRYLDNAKFR